tara:strand:- start:2185 stop:2364 length:180 start_codon:yes stop_codon:yes gene_type:complete
MPEATLKRMSSFFARHGGAGASSAPPDSAANIAWGLWGGTAGKAWAQRELNRIERERKA